MEDVDTRALFERDKEKEKDRLAYNVKDLQLVLPPHAHAHPASGHSPQLKYECVRCKLSVSYKVCIVEEESHFAFSPFLLFFLRISCFNYP